MSYRAVIFDWRGTLVTTLTDHEWVTRALADVGMSVDVAGSVLACIETANGPDDRLDAPGVDSDADLHRQTFMDVFADAGLQADLAEALYALDADPAYNLFAHDVPETLRALQQAGVRIAVVSDIHFDLRPVFADAGLLDYIDVFTLSFEQGVQKPNPLMFDRTLEALGVNAAECLMVGDRSKPDGPAVEQGITTLLVPPLRNADKRRLHQVLALCQIRAAPDQVSAAGPRLRAMRGRVASGRGDLAQWMLRYSDAYERALGVRLEPGSLNVILNEPWVMQKPQIRLEPSEVGVGMAFVPCRLNGERCWLVRTDENNAGAGDHPLTVVEVVSSLHLRTVLNVQDGEEVVIDLIT